MWNGRPLNLHLVHLNKNKYDNRLENLVLLCPNCHSQNKKETAYAKLIFLKKCIACDRDIPDDNEEERCQKCKKKGRRISVETLEREIAILGLDGTARRHKTDERSVKNWLESP
jgi:hypothetical protein